MLHTHARAEHGEIRRVQIHVAMARAVICILNVFDHAIAAIVHQNHEQIGFLLRSASQLTYIEHEATIAHESYCFNSALRSMGGRKWLFFFINMRRNGRAYAHLQALANAAAQRMNTGSGMPQHGAAIAPHRVAQSDVAHPNALPAQLTCHNAIDRILELRIRAQ